MRRRGREGGGRNGSEAHAPFFLRPFFFFFGFRLLVLLLLLMMTMMMMWEEDVHVGRGHGARRGKRRDEAVRRVDR